MKKVLAGLLAVLMVVTMLPVTAMAAMPEYAQHAPEVILAEPGQEGTTAAWDNDKKIYTVTFGEVASDNTQALKDLNDITSALTVQTADASNENLVDATGVSAVFTKETKEEDNITAHANLAITVNGYIADTTYYIKGTKPGVGDNAPEVTLYVKVPVPSNMTPIETAAITLSKADVQIGGALPMPTTTENNVTLSVKWTKDGTEVTETNVAGTYVATVTVTPKTGYKIAENAKFTIEGQESGCTANDDGSVTITGQISVKVVEPVKEPTVLTPTVKVTDGKTITKVYDGKTDPPTGWKDNLTVSFTKDTDTAVTLTEGTDYELSAVYSAADVGSKLKVTITLKNTTDYVFANKATSTEKEVEAPITKKSITAVTGNWSSSDLTYTGTSQTCKYILTGDSANLVNLGTPKITKRMVGKHRIPKTLVRILSNTLLRLKIRLTMNSH